MDSHMASDPNELIEVTDAEEIASIREREFRAPDGRMNILGANVGGKWFAYRHSLEKWRAKQPASSVRTGQP